MKKLLLILTIGIALFVMAQESTPDTASDTDPPATNETVADSEKRLIIIDSPGGQQSGNLRRGPLFFEHPDPEGVQATVSTLAIFAQKAELRTPETAEEMSLTEARGQRIATFSEGVRVTRGRLEAFGETLFYDEATGIGLLTGNVNITVEGRTEEAEAVFITALEAEFDVDTDVSISRGDVKLDNGNQQAEADEMEYEEERTLGVLRCTDRQCQITREDEDGNFLVITADETRVLTDDKRLHAISNVTVVDADITSTGDEVFFDDEQSLAEVIGNPAESINEADGITLTGARILQDIEFDVIEVIDSSVESDFNAEDYLLTREQE